MAAKVHNKKIEYDVVNTISGEDLKNSDIEYLNDNFTGWCIFESVALEEYIINVKNWENVKSWGNNYILEKNNKRFNYNDLYTNSVKRISNQDFSYTLTSSCDVKKIKIKEKEIKRKYTSEDPYGEEDWLDEKTKIITKFKIFEALSNPFDDKELPMIYNQHFTDNYMGFREEFLQDLKNKLIGKTIRIDAERLYGWREKDE